MSFVNVVMYFDGIAKLLASDCERLATGAEDQVDLVMRGQKPLSLAMGFESAHYFLSFAGRSVRDFDRVV